MPCSAAYLQTRAISSGSRCACAALRFVRRGRPSAVWGSDADRPARPRLGYPAVVVPLTMSAYALLQRNLLYTAVTRAKRLVVLVGSRKALAVAVRTAGTGRRHTALTHRLQDPGIIRA